MFYRKRIWLATAVTLTLLLTIASVASAAQSYAPPKPGTASPTPTPTRALPDTTGEEGSQNAAPAKPQPTRALPGTTGGGQNGGGQTGESNTGGGNTAAPSWPPPELIVAHAATPFQLSPIGEGLQSYFIGPDGTGYTGPYIPSFTNLAQTYPYGAAVTLYSGVNPGSAKSVTIQYLPADGKLRISTYYPDTQYDTDKPYVFTVDSGHNVVHDQW
ncbi:MAG: hypothetical protein OXK78_07560 [Caldilineaceae bacterium]|nr:hypothetical protein [Caldilineaceae bacterium]